MFSIINALCVAKPFRLPRTSCRTEEAPALFNTVAFTVIV